VRELVPTYVYVRMELHVYMFIFTHTPTHIYVYIHVCCSVLQCVDQLHCLLLLGAVCCIVLQYIAVCYNACCSVLQ